MRGRVAATVVVALVGATACDTERDGGAPSDASTTPWLDAPTTTATARIEPSGGVIAIDGITLTIPPGSLLQSTVVTLSRTAERPSEAFGVGISATYRIEPTDLALLAPVRARVQLDRLVQHPTLWVHADHTFTPLDGSYSEGHVSAELHRFGDVFVGRGPVQLAMSPSHVELLPINLGASTELAIAVENHGGMTATDAFCRVGGPHAADLRIRSASCDSIGADQLCYWYLVDKPVALGPRMATLSCGYNEALVATARITASSEPGLESLIAPRDLDFGDVRVGTTSPLLGVTITNSYATPIGIPTVQLVPDGSPDDVGDFAIAVTTCTAALAPGEQCAVYISAQPTLARQRFAQLLVSARPGGTGFARLRFDARQETEARSADGRHER